MSIIKDKFKDFLAKFKVTATETTPDGIFFKEEDVERLMAIDAENESLKASAITDAAAVKAANAERDAALLEKTTALGFKKTAEDALAVANTKIGTQATEIITLKAKVTGKPVRGKGPVANVDVTETEDTDEYSWSEQTNFGKKNPA